MTAPRRALLAGATGLVGSALMAQLLADPRTASLTALSRRRLDPPSGTLPGRFACVVADFGALDALVPAPADDAYCALGTTIAAAGSQLNFARVDLEFVTAFARYAKRAGCTRFMLVSALGADPRSAVFYNRTKGEAEAAVVAVGFEAVHIARPSLLLGPRPESRPAESLGKALGRLVAPLLRGRLRRYRPIAAHEVAAALIAAAHRDLRGAFVHHFHEPDGAMERAG
jgi:uncharacterized protein YbjT (DUF2867 family)